VLSSRAAIPLPPRAPFRFPHPRISLNTALYLHICPYQCHSSTLPALPHQSDPAHLTFRSPIALSSYHPNPTHESSAPRRQLDGGVPLQLTVAAVARPVRSSVGALGVLAAERSWLLLAQTASARRSVQPVSPGPAPSPWLTLPAATPQRRSPVSSRRCPPIWFRRPGSGCPAVRCPVTWGRRPAGPALGRLLSTRPVSSRPLSTRPVSSRLVSAPSVRTRPSPPTSGGGVGA
jgi:hypothetical protein